jgi:aminoglycoside 6'-N-acetyltransferase
VWDPSGVSAPDAGTDGAKAHQTSADQAGATMVLRPLAPGDEAELRRIHATAEVSRWWDVPDERFLWDEPRSTRLTIEVDGAVVGLIQFWEEQEPRYRHAGIDLFLDPVLHGRGLGAEAVGRVVRQLIDERGHHRITIDPAAINAAAIRACERVGFRAVGVMRAAERDAGGGGLGQPADGAARRRRADGLSRRAGGGRATPPRSRSAGACGPLSRPPRRRRR